MADHAFPPVVSESEWRAALDEQLAAEKALTRQKDSVAAGRRRLPMTEVDSGYVFTGDDGTKTLLDLFEGRSQLIVYHFMFGPDWDEGCAGCTWLVDAMTHPAYLEAKDTSIALVSLASIDKLQAYKARMGWHRPWYSSAGSSFNADMGATVAGEEHHGVSVFVRDGESVYRSYHVGNRGVEHLGTHWTYLDLTPFGRRETWEDSPAGWPQEPPYQWGRRPDGP